MPEQAPATALNPETWVEKYGDYLFHFALGQLRNSTDAENVVQETLLAALESMKNFSGRSSEKTWLTGILKHKIVDHIRKGYREKPVTDLRGNDDAINDFFDHSEHLKKSPSAWTPEPAKLLENQEFWKAFEKCQDKLPKVTRDAFILREMENLRGQEICEILNVTQANLWVMLHRARLQLRQCLEINWFEKAENV